MRQPRTPGHQGYGGLRLYRVSGMVTKAEKQRFREIAESSKLSESHVVAKLVRGLIKSVEAGLHGDG